MYKKLLLLTLLSSSALLMANGLTALDASRGERVIDNPVFNPSALLQQHYRWQLGIEAGMAVNARSGLVSAGEQWLLSSVEDYQSFDQVKTTKSAQQLSNDFDALLLAADSFNPVENANQDLSALERPNRSAGENIASLRSALDQLQRLLNDNVQGLEALNDKPVTALLLANADLIGARQQLPLLVSVKQNLQLGSALALRASDAEIFTGIIGDADQFLIELEGLQKSMVDLIDAAKAWQEAVETAASADDIESAKADFQQVKIEFDLLQENYQSFQAGALQMQQGELTMDLDFDLADLESIVHVDASLLQQVTLGSAWQQQLGSLPVRMGANVHLRRVQLQRFSYGIEELQQVTQSELMSQVEQARTRYLINFDLASSYAHELPVGTALASLVLQDIVPYRSDKALAQGLELRFSPQVTLGLAYQSSVVNAHASLDLNPSQPMLTNHGQAQQLLALGVETRWGKSLAYRLGYQNDLRQSGAYSWHTGLGLTPFGYGLDIGAYLQPADLTKARPWLNDWYLGFATRLSATF